MNVGGAPHNFEVLVVIVNHGTPKLVVECLRSLRREIENRAARVVVVDNASGDDSVPLLEAAIADFGARVDLVPAPRNGGFAYGNNLGLHHADARWGRSRYVWLLNPDTLVHPGGLHELLAFLDARRHAAIAGSRCEDADGAPRRSAFRFHSILGELEGEARLGALTNALRRFKVAPETGEQPMQADWVSGASMLVRREVFDEVGLLDEEFFLYYEETDFARRAALAGFECWYVPTSRIVHACGASTGLTGRERHKRRVPRYWFESRRRYFTKHHGRAYAALADVAFVAGASIYRLGRALREPSDLEPPQRLRDFVRYNLQMWIGR